jgi:hypothetical protein
MGYEGYDEKDQEAAQHDESEEQRPQILWLRGRELALTLDVVEGAICVLLWSRARLCWRICCRLSAVWCRCWGTVLYLNCEQRALPWALLVHTGAVSAMATSR